MKHSGARPQQDGTYPAHTLPRSDAHVVAFAAAARLAHRQGDYDIARGLYQASLAVAMALENERGIARALEGLGSVALYQQDDVIVARQFHEQALTTYRAIADTCSQLGSATFTATWARGQALTADEAVHLALDAAESIVSVQTMHRRGRASGL